MVLSAWLRFRQAVSRRVDMVPSSFFAWVQDMLRKADNTFVKDHRLAKGAMEAVSRWV